MKLSVDETSPVLQLTWMPDTGATIVNTVMSHVKVKPRSLHAIDTTSIFSIRIILNVCIKVFGPYGCEIVLLKLTIDYDYLIELSAK